MVHATWSVHHLDALDTTSKGLRDVHIEPRGPADLWLRGSGTLDGPADEWSFESLDSKAAGSSQRDEMVIELDRISYPLRVRFEVALADQPECEFGSAPMNCFARTSRQPLIIVVSSTFSSILWPSDIHDTQTN